MILLFDIGNTHTHLGLAGTTRVLRHANIPTADLLSNRAEKALARFVGRRHITAAALCSVVPRATPRASELAVRLWNCRPFVLTHRTAAIEIDYPSPETIGADRLANAVAAVHLAGAPSVVIDFGTAVTFDVVDGNGRYAGGIIAPGLAAMTDYLHEKTALLPRIRIREIDRAIGKSTEEAMQIGAVHGYRGLIRELLRSLEQALHTSDLPVLATGGYAKLLASRLPEISDVVPNLTLEGLRLTWARRAETSKSTSRHAHSR